MSGIEPRSCWRRFAGHESGATAVEFGLVGGTFLLLLVAILDFGNAYWQWNRAAKALQLGVRLAAVSDPVSSDLATFDGTQLGADEGDPMPYFERRCDGATRSCTNGTYDAGAMATLLYGRGKTACPGTPQDFPPMCQVFSRIQPQNVQIDYVQTGLGYAGHRPIPTITMRLTGLTFDFIVLGRMLGLASIPMTGLSVTATAEDMSGR